ncbi:MAG: carbohydrate binding family 9 domain-containing protein, partial [Psychrosphaera sp.]|nr:carbohydrate binding family 9 domain-containing protein [Psychrosphaera sp.]
MFLIKNRITRALATVIVCSHCVSIAWADTNPSSKSKNLFNLTHQQQGITVDGVMDEPQWQNATQIELKYENDPGEGLAAPVKTMAYLYEDGESLHIAFKASDPDPAKIRAYLRDRDSLWNDDHVGLVIDTFADERTGFEFHVNPMGAQADMRMTDSNGWRADASWDAIWDSAATINDDGYIVEMTIPFNALRFPDHDGELTWNIALTRTYPRDVQHELSSYKSDRNIDCNICQFDQIKGFKTVKAGNNFQMTPTLTSSRSDTKDVNSDAGWQSGDFNQDLGLDVRWGITQDMVLNATINPDFSQIEADAAQLNINSTFSLFYREKRPFFLD